MAADDAVDAPGEGEPRSAFKEREAEMLRELSALYTKLNQVREKRAKAEQESTSGAGGDAEDGAVGSRRRRRVLLVTLSLPFRLISEDAQSQWRAEFDEHARRADGAMDTYLCLHEHYDCVWIGSVHGEIDASEQNTLREQLLQERNYFPVVLDPKREALFYQGFCQTVLWPLFHSFPPTTDDQIMTHEVDIASTAYGPEDDRSMEKMWQAYVAVNQAFADAVQAVYEEGDLIWVQGYHLALVPQMVQNLFPNEHIHMGYFMHIPFPSAELYRILNYRDEILTGILGADLVGFQTYEYARHFQSACVRLLGLESSHKGVEWNGHFARVTICPVGIDADRYLSLMQSDVVQEVRQQLATQFAGKKLLLGVDPLDLTKGLVHKLLAVEELFTLRPELAKEVVFLQIVTGSSTSSTSLTAASSSLTAESFSSSSAMASSSSALVLGSQVEALVSRINSKLQDVGAEMPVQYLNKEIAVEDLVALYSLADTLVITPVRDGMNTVPFEYVVCREAAGQHARVVLSEFAGCAQSLGGAILVNPWNTEEVVAALARSLQSDDDEVMRQHQHMYSYVSTFTSRHWADNFLEQLRECSEENATAGSGRELSRRDMTSAYARSSRRLIFLTYEGVLAPEASIPELVYPPQELIWQLSMLTSDPRNTVVLVSARSTAVCELWFAGLAGNVVLVAEYGVYVKWVGESSGWRCMVPNLDVSWWEHVLPLLEYYTERTPGAFIERKGSSIAWHYRDCDLDHGLWQASELLVSLREITRSLPVSVCPGNRLLEVRPQKVSKGSLFERMWEFMNWATLFPDDPPVTTEYFGDLVTPTSSPFATPRGAFPTSYKEWKAKNTGDEANPFSTTGQGDNNSKSVGNPLDGEEEEDAAVAAHRVHHELALASEDYQPVDFVLVIASGDDRMDEDLFAVLVPPPIDLEAYCLQLEKDELMEESMSEAPLYSSSRGGGGFDDMDDERGISTMSVDSGSVHGLNAFTSGMTNDLSMQDLLRTSSSYSDEHRSSSASLNAAPPSPNAGAGYRRRSDRDTISASTLTANSSSNDMLLSDRPAALARLPARGATSDADFLALGENMTKLTPVVKASVSDDAANMFPRTLLTTPSNARRDEITEKSKFTPRRDFPPSAALFKAMRTKYGDKFGLHKMPDTPAACWALVCPPTARAKLEDDSIVVEMIASDADGSAQRRFSSDRHTSFGSLAIGGGGGSSTSMEALGGSPDAEADENAVGSATGESFTSFTASVSEMEEPSSPDKRDMTEEEDQYRFPVNTFVCTLGRKLSQAPYYIKNSGDLFQLLQEMGMSSHIRRQRLLSLGSPVGVERIQVAE
jgi:trehalose 6-phosphate synthase/phosphatase